MSDMRLQKFLAHAGVASRRTSETMIVAGRVKVNGVVCTELGTTVDSEKDRVEVDGRIIEGVSSLIYLLVNKPQGYITTLDDPEGRPIITDLVPANMPRVYPVGRLDWDSDGAVLLTNDGDLTNLLTHPSHEIEKTYAVKVVGVVEETAKELEELRKGVEIEPDVITKPAVVKVGRQTDKNTWLEFRIAEGRNRQIRKMCEVVGYRVMRLRRIAIGPLTIAGVRSGQFRALDNDEVRSLYNAVGKTPPELAEPSRRARKRTEKTRKYSRRPKARSVRTPGDAAPKTQTTPRSERIPDRNSRGEKIPRSAKTDETATPPRERTDERGGERAGKRGGAQSEAKPERVSTGARVRPEKRVRTEKPGPKTTKRTASPRKKPSDKK
jgi:23S rRNA pseudouridine2605 synthase